MLSVQFQCRLRTVWSLITTIKSEEYFISQETMLVSACKLMIFEKPFLEPDSGLQAKMKEPEQVAY